MSRRYTETERVNCVLTDRWVVLSTEIVQLSAIGGTVATAEGRKSCGSKGSECPKECVYYSGGAGFGLDPRTGKRIVIT